MADERLAAPDSTAVRVALWRAMHVEVDPPPHVIWDEVGLRLAAPDEGWRQRPDMDPQATSGYRAHIVARARFIEDLVAERASHGVLQYVLLGAGLDTFAQRRPEIASRLRVFEVDRPGPQEWKRQRLVALGFSVPEWLRLVPVDFEAGQSLWERLAAAGFDASRPTVVASTGVSVYLSPDANRATRASGTPFISFFTPPQMLALAREAGFREAGHISAADLTARYFSGRADGFRPARGEEFLVATT